MYADSLYLSSVIIDTLFYTIPQVWKANDQHDMFYCDNITDDVNLSILCVNISGDDSTLVASTGNGLVAVSIQCYLILCCTVRLAAYSDHLALVNCGQSL